MTTQMTSIEPCPFCGNTPVIEIKDGFYVGGCPQDIPKAVYQPATMPEQAVIQWNTVVNIMAPVVKGY